MKQNVGGVDRKVRLIAGPLLAAIAAAGLGGVLNIGVTGTAAVVLFGFLLVAGLVFFTTGVTQKCPANSIAGVNTCDRDN